MTLERRTPLAGGKPLTRKTPLTGGGSLKRAPLARTSAPTRTAPMPRMAAPARAESARKPARRTGATLETRAAVIDRDKGACVRCGAPASDLDHRQGRGAGGTKGEESARINGPAWLLTLCGSGNTSGCHGWKEANADGEPERLGYKLRRNGPRRDAAAVPVLTRTGWALFDDAGGRASCPPPPDGDARNA